MDKQRQIYSLEIPAAYYHHYKRGTRAVFACGYMALTERFTGKNYIYDVVDTLTGDIEKLFRRKAPLLPEEYDTVSDRMMTSDLGQRYPAYIDPDEIVRADSIAGMSADLDAIFKYIMPKNGFSIRERQIDLAQQMLDTLYHRRTLIAEAGLGIGKTYAYIVASLIIKLRKTNDFWMRMIYGYSKNFSEKTRMPIVISTSSIALQKAIVTDYIPRVSNVLMGCGFIPAPLTCALRKGKEHYICDHRLLSFIGSKKTGGRADIKDLLNNPVNRIDMDEMDWLNPFEKSRINVPNHCSRDCPDFGNCRYMKLINLYMTDKYDFQVCNHNYYIADTIRRNQKATPLLPNYQSVIIDEAHKFLPAVRQMYGVSISNTEAEAFEEPLRKLRYEDSGKYELMMSYYNTACRHYRYMFKELAGGMCEAVEGADRVKVDFGETALKSLRGFSYSLDRMKTILKENISDPDLIYFKKLMGKLNEFTRRIEKFQCPSELIYWFECPDGVIQDFYTYGFDEWKLTANTVIHYHANIRKALQYAVKMGYIPSNPALYVERPKIQEFVGSVYDVDEINELLTVVKGMKIEMGVMFAAFYGLRRSEIIGLKWDAIDFKNKRITIKHTVSETSIDGKFMMVSKDRAKNKSSMRSLPLVPVFADYLIERQKQEVEYKRLCGRSYNYDFDGYIYVDGMGNLTKPNFLSDNFGTILKNNNMRKIRFHDLRHSCASVLLANGVSLKEIQEWLGHSNFSTTANIYAHLDKGTKDRSAAAMLNTGIKIGPNMVSDNNK